ncbi:MAG: type I-C CRISPR-associated protein Cas8c/Csd1 [Planctomycetota bacterium]|jgi:hypothetical protein|nr:type I-C CRISPR-associated protein Cas8c/Csd1 [Planctomycetota bacterium]
MINELYALAEALPSNIEATEWHRQLKELPKVLDKNPCFKIQLNGDGSVYDIGEITEPEKMSFLRTWQFGANGSSFPAFNLPPLSKYADAKKEKEKRKQQTAPCEKWLKNNAAFNFPDFEKWHREVILNWIENDKDESGKKTENGKAFDKVKIVLNPPRDTFANITRNGKTPTNAITELLDILQKFKVKDGVNDEVDVSKFRAALDRHLNDKLRAGENIKTLLKFLSSDKQVSVILDVQDWQKFSYPVAHEKSIVWLNEVLNNSEKKIAEKSISDASAPSEALVDAFGEEFSGAGEPMPEVKLPGKLAGVKLRAMFRDHRCQYRYNRIDDDSYPISRENRAKIKKALEWLKEPERQGKTWGLSDIDEIIFAYPSIIPPSPPKFAALLGASSGEENDDRSSALFAGIAEDVIKSLAGLAPESKPQDVQIFAIRKMDRARSKVVFYRNYTTERLILAATDWQKACENIPPVSFRAWTDKPLKKNNVNNIDDGNADEKSKPEIVEPQTPKPLQVAKVVNRIWKMSGELAAEPKKTPKKMQYYQGLELMLDDHLTARDSYLLRVLIDNSRGLVAYLGNLLHGGGVLPNSSRELRESYRYLLPVLGLFLFRQKIYKETYMESLPYLLGQMLKVSDELHALYCKIVRNDEVPPQLAGNSLLVNALETPVQALAQLAPRINPYISWAKQYRTKKIEETGKESWRAGWYLSLYEQSAANLNLEKIARFNDLEKAQLFVGYLAAFPKKEKLTDAAPKTEA